jgi:hypothetical protein
MALDAKEQYADPIWSWLADKTGHAEKTYYLGPGNRIKEWTGPRDHTDALFAIADLLSKGAGVLAPKPTFGLTHVSEKGLARRIIVENGEAWYQSSGTSGGANKGEWVRFYGLARQPGGQSWFIKGLGEKFPAGDRVISKSLSRSRSFVELRSVTDADMKFVNDWLRANRVYIGGSWGDYWRFAPGAMSPTIEQIP